MKKISLTLCVLCAVLFTVTACGGMNNMENAGEDVKNGVEQGVENTKDAANEVKKGAENMGNAVKNSAVNTAENIGIMTSNADTNVDRTSFITEEMAKQNAVKKAGVNASDVKFTKVEFDRDDGRYVYEIDFMAGNTEYEAEVSAADGSILSWDVDKHD